MSWMDEFLPHPTNRFCPKPFPCLQSHSPAIETLPNLHPNPDCTIPAEKNHTSVSGLGAPLPRDPAKCLEQTCQGQWGCISKAPIPRLSGKDSLQPYAKLNKLGNSLCPWEPLSWTSPPPGCEMHPANGQPVCQILLVLSLTQANS